MDTITMVDKHQILECCIMASRFAKDYFREYRYITVPKKNGKGTRRIMEYIGEWYGIDCSRKEFVRLKIWTACLTVVALAVYLLCILSGANVNIHKWAALPSTLLLIPMLLFLMGVGSFLFAKEKWEVRVYHSGYRRMYRGAIATAILFCISVIAGIIFTASVSQPAGLLDYGYLTGMLIGTSCVTALVAMIRANPAIVVQASIKDKQHDD